MAENATGPDAPPGRPTMRDVAQRAGVSYKTVSRVLNSEPGVSAATTTRILDAIAVLGFQRNDVARMLRVGRSTRTLGLVIEDVANPFFSAINRAVERVAREHGYLVIAGSTDKDAGIEAELIRSLLEKRVDGLLVAPIADDHRFLLPELARGMPVVFLDRPPGGIDADVVLLDNVRGGRLATAHLLAHGHRRIAMLGDDPAIYTVPERLRGYTDELAVAGVSPDPRLIRLGSHDEDAAERAVRDLLALPDPPTAVFAGNNRNAVGALRAIHQHPRPVALVGFDDLELAEVFATPLTVVAHDPARMGEEAARLLWRRIDGVTGPAERVVLPTRIIARGSGEIPPP